MFLLDLLIYVQIGFIFEHQAHAHIHDTCTQAFICDYTVVTQAVVNITTTVLMFYNILIYEE